MKKIVSYLLLVSIMAFALAGCGRTSQDTGKQNAESKAEKASSAATDQPASSDQSSASDQSAASGSADTADTSLLSGKHHVTIEVEKYGTISAELDADIAPITVTNFVNLAQEGFYDGLTFHRIMDGFMIQGGDPSGDGTGGSGKEIQGEFEENGVKNTLSHKRGVLSMARASDYDSASSQFFIVQSDSDFLDGEYAAFGEVTEGMEIVDQICKDTPVEDSNGTVLAENQPKITKITVTD